MCEHLLLLQASFFIAWEALWWLSLLPDLQWEEQKLAYDICSVSTLFLQISYTIP